LLFLDCEDSGIIAALSEGGETPNSTADCMVSLAVIFFPSVPSLLPPIHYVELAAGYRRQTKPLKAPIHGV
jgi:hypothetical protein